VHPQNAPLVVYNVWAATLTSLFHCRSGHVIICGSFGKEEVEDWRKMGPSLVLGSSFVEVKWPRAVG
jgi:hypothetical protein